VKNEREKIKKFEKNRKNKRRKSVCPVEIHPDREYIIRIMGRTIFMIHT